MSLTIITPQRDFAINTDIEDWRAQDKKGENLNKKDIKKIKSSLFLTLKLNKELELNTSAPDFLNLIQNSNLREIDMSGNNALFLALRYHAQNNLNLCEKSWYHLIDNSYYLERTEKGRNAFMLYCYHNKRQNLNFSADLVEKLLKHTTHFEADILGETNFSIALAQYRRENLFLTSAQWDRLIEGVLPTHLGEKQLDPFLAALRYRGLDAVPLTFEQMLRLENLCGYDNTEKYQNLSKIDKAKIKDGYSDFIKEKNSYQEKQKFDKALPKAYTQSLSIAQSSVRSKI